MIYRAGMGSGYNIPYRSGTSWEQWKTDQEYKKSIEEEETQGTWSIVFIVILILLILGFVYWIEFK